MYFKKMAKINKLKTLPRILLFVYNRPNHLKSTIKSLKQNKFYNLFDITIFCDGPKNKSELDKVKKVRDIVKNLKGFKSKKIIINQTNNGLSKSIIKGITYAFRDKNTDRIIVLEDDLNFNKFFLEFMCNCLDKYRFSKNIGSVSGYSFFNGKRKFIDELYITPRHSSWGWGTWKNRWKKFKWSKKWIQNSFSNRKIIKKIEIGGKDIPKILKKKIDGKIDSWSIVFDLNCYINNLYSVNPSKSLVYNIGLDNSGTHCTIEGNLNKNYNAKKRIKVFPELNIKAEIFKETQAIFNIGYYERIKNKLKKILN